MNEVRVVMFRQYNHQPSTLLYMWYLRYDIVCSSYLSRREYLTEEGRSQDTSRLGLSSQSSCMKAGALRQYGI